MANATKFMFPQSIKKYALRALPYYFYVLGVIAAIGSALLVMATEVQDRTWGSLGTTDLVISIF
jgi:hypothetical protein